MKKLIAIIMLLFPMFCLAQLPVTKETKAKKAFLEKFYADWDTSDQGVLDYAYVKRHITKKTLKTLKDNYEYDCDGECLATWMFSYEGGAETGNLISRTIEVKDANHFVVKHNYDLAEYDVILTVIKIGKTYKIDDIECVRSVYKGE